jgi:kumamolisin
MTEKMNEILRRALPAFPLCVFLFLLAPGEHAVAQAGPGGISFSAIQGSLRSTSDKDTGEFSSPNISVEVVLAPDHESELRSLLTNLYDPQSPSYHQWLGKGEFDNRFAPSASRVASLTDYLQARGLAVEKTSSPFLLRAMGSSKDVAAAFQTTLRNYRNRNGVAYFSNSEAVHLPSVLAEGVRGVVGLTNSVRAHPMLVRSPRSASSRVTPTQDAPSAGASNQIPSCEAPYPTAAEWFALVDYGTLFPSGYGGGPGCSGLTPSQVNSIYGAPNLGPSAKGLGVTLAVIEFSAYRQSDIAFWTHYFYGPAFAPPLEDITVDGGPLNPVCPAGDECPPELNGYAGDAEVDLDIEMQLGIAPDARQILVYNAPNDYTGQTGLDEYTRIAEDDIADVISSSWGSCENDIAVALAQAENLIFQQMALQGQSVFGASGDSGAFDCILQDGTTIVNVDDPSSQPWVTSVGGTSLESFNPDTNPNPKYPTNVETVWNVDGLCNNSAPSPANDNYGGFFWCIFTGGGGGGNSQFWGRPIYQFGAGIINQYTTHGNGSTQCALAKTGTPCREVPDVSANADPLTPYAFYCTGDASTPNSLCVPQIFGSGWLGIGGTSTSAPLWSGIIADRDGYQHGRTGNANPLLYVLYNLNYQGYFHDITGSGQAVRNNGLFPTTPGFDLATGIGTPRMGAIITGIPQK